MELRQYVKEEASSVIHYVRTACHTTVSDLASLSGRV